MTYNGKPLLFYSNMCHHSKRLLSRIGSTNLVNNINFICIDDPRIKVPEIIQSVPTLFDPSIGRPLINAELFGWVESVLVVKREINLHNNNILPRWDATTIC